MVFREEFGDRFDTLLYCGIYQPYRRHGEKNPNFDAYSGLVLDFKENQTAAIERFRAFLEPRIAPDVPIAIVPSHDPAKTTSGLRTLAQKLAAADRIDATDCLVRKVKIDKLATGGNRSIEVHLGSIGVQNEKLFQGLDVLLLDDVTTSGNSLEACKQILLKAGANRVQKLVIAKTA